MLGEEIRIGSRDGLAEGGEEGCLEGFGEFVGLFHIGIVVDEDFVLEVPSKVNHIIDVDADGVVEIEFTVFFDGQPLGEWGLAEAFLDLGVGVDVVFGDLCVGPVFAFVEDVFDGFG